MSYSCRSYKNTIPNYTFIKGQTQIGMFKKNILQVVMFQNVSNVFKCKYVLFHLNMLRLCQEVNKGVSMFHVNI